MQLFGAFNQIKVKVGDTKVGKLLTFGSVDKLL